MAWSDVQQLLEGMPPGSTVDVGRGLPHPRDAGATESYGLPAIGKVADWRFPPAADCSGLHVHELADGTLRAHLDRVHPACDPVEHLRVDAPDVFFVAAALAGGIAGGLLFGGRGVAGGLLLGGIAGLVGRFT